MRRRLTVVLLGMVFLLPLPASAWNAAGHRLSALIAWQQLDEVTRSRLTRLLSQHPDHERWVARAKGFTPDLAAFLEASTWADEIRNDRRFYDVGEEAPTAPLPGFPEMARHRDWHYVNRPLGHSPKDHHASGELERQLALLAGTLANANAGDAQRAYALPWLLHLVADAHQPLHVVSRYDAAGRGDEGGNRLNVEHSFYPRRSALSLHAYWDDLPGPPWLRGEPLVRAAEALVAAYPPPPPAGGPQRWLDESEQIARDSAYPPVEAAVPALTTEFHERAQAIARQRVAEAGYRLAALLQRLMERGEH
jgi:hypothetical protein